MDTCCLNPPAVSLVKGLLVPRAFDVRSLFCAFLAFLRLTSCCSFGLSCEFSQTPNYRVVKMDCSH